MFGIGYGNYGDYAGLVAHNSFVHSFVELGFFGGTFFFGMFFFALYSLYKMASIHPDLRHPEITRMKPYVMGILAGWSTGLLTLSRCYVPPTFMVLGTVAAYLNYVNFTLRPHGMLVYFDREHVTYMVISSAALFVSIYAVILVLGR